MGVFKPSELKARLREIGAYPNQALSQNFLIDGNILKKILKGALVSQEDLIVEIGPGLGALTEALLQEGAHVIAIEKDRKLGHALKEKNLPKLELLTSDFLDIDVPSLLKEKLKEGQKAKVVANIPYHLTGIILQRLLPLHACISSVTLMVQKEITERCLATKGDKNYSSFTLFTQFHSKPSFLFTVKSSCFYPKPTVQSAVIHFELKAPPQGVNSDFFFKVMRTAFDHRRKMLKASLKELFPTEIPQIKQNIWTQTPQININIRI